MKNRVILGLLFSVFFASFASGGTNTIPKGIAHFRLGDPLDGYLSRINTAFPFHDIDYPYLNYYEIYPFEGFSGGFVATGNCTGSRKVIRIKLKYSDSSEGFFNRIKSELEKRYGKPQAYLGDPFHLFISWKWRFEDQEGNVVTMILEHYSGKGEDYASGTAIKLNYTSEIGKEELCFKNRRSRVAPEKEDNQEARSLSIEYFLPY